MALDTSHGTVVLVEQSDERLSTAEDSKRTGEPLKSVGANVSIPVPASVAITIANDHLKDETYTTAIGTTFPAHLEDIHARQREDEGYVAKTNEQKAAEHAEYSANLIRQRQKEEEALAKKEKNGFRQDEAIQASNIKRAEEYEAEVAQWKRDFDAESASVKPAIDVHNEVIAATKDLDTIDDRELAEGEVGDITETPDASESSVKEALRTKDLIISGDKSFQDEASDPKNLLKYDHPGTTVSKDDIQAMKDAQNEPVDTAAVVEAAQNGPDVESHEIEPASV